MAFTQAEGKRVAKPVRKAWRLVLFGRPHLRDPQGRDFALERRAAALFALVALEPGIARSRVASLVWPDAQPARARQALRQQLLRLRSLAKRELLVGAETLSLAEGVEAGLQARPGGGELLGDFDYSGEEALGRWVEEQRAQRRDAEASRLAARIEEAERRGDLERAARLAGDLVARTGDEEHHRLLIRLHYLRGDVAQALQAYERLRQALARELGVEPSAATRQLARTLDAAQSATRPAAGAPPASVLRPPRLVGRDREWDALVSCWEERAPVVLLGVGGMGKTRLATDFAATRGAVVSVAARSGDEQVAYAVLARLLRGLLARAGVPPRDGVRRELATLLPELGEARPSGDAPDAARLLRAVEAVVEAGVGEGLEGIVVEDLHHADAASLEALQSSALAHPKLARLFTSRPEELAREPRTRLAGDGVPETFRRIALPPLTPAHVAALLESLDLPGFADAGLAERIARHTGGNPLFVLETVKAMLAQDAAGAQRPNLPVAGSMGALIERRIGCLSAEAVKLARCAAVAGQDFSAELAASVLGTRPLDLADAWNELSMAQVLRDGAFVHDLVRDAALASVPGPIARRLHEEIAAFLEGHGTQPGRVAAHWEAAGRPREAGVAWVRASGQAKDSGRRTEEAQLLARAAAAFAETGDGASRFDALLRRVEAVLVGDVGEATAAALAEAREAADTDDQRLRVLACEVAYADHHYESERVVEAARAGLELATRRGRPEQMLAFAISMAGALSDLRRMDEALALLAPFEAQAHTADPRARIDYFVQKGIALDLANRLAEALRAFDVARLAAAAHGHKDLLASVLSNIATTTSKRGRIAEAVELGSQGLQLWRESETLRGLPSMTETMLAHRMRDVGRYEEAIAMLEGALEAFRRADSKPWVAAAAHRLALAYSQVGQHARARKLIDEDPQGCSVKTRAIWIAHRAEILRASGGDGAAAAREARALLEPGVDDGNNRLVDLLAAAVVGPEEGEALATATAAWAAARERLGMALAAHTRAASCALAQGATGRALPHAEAALRLFADAEPDNFYRGEVWWVCYRALAAAGRQDDAGRVLARGRDWILDIGARRVPAAFRESFLHRNVVNRDILNAARRLPGTNLPT